MQEAIFTAALGVESPWFVESVAFDACAKRLDIHLTFKRGSRFEVDGAQCPVHDTVEKRWRHLNFFGERKLKTSLSMAVLAFRALLLKRL